MIMKKFISIVAIFVMCATYALAQNNLNINGDWTPDGYSYLGDIKIKSIGNGEYKIRLSTVDGVVTVTGEMTGQTIYADWEDEAPEYGEFWIGSGPIENGRKKEILVGHEPGYYGSNGAVSGWLGDNQNYQYTNSRASCATVEKSMIYIKLHFTSEGMTAYFKNKGVYYKDRMPMFYQESNWSPGNSYTQW